jgi:energy-coupling factor transport system ATP-binding protein
MDDPKNSLQLPPDTQAIQVEELNFSYPVSKAPVLEDVSFSINPGEFILLIGPSGCGKSTISLCLNGIIPHNIPGKLEGNIEVYGWRPLDREVHEMATRVGIVFQDADSQICNIFIGDEIAFGAQNLLVPKEEIFERMEEVLAAVGLSGMRDRPVFNLSGGQKQRLAIGSVLAMEPFIMVFDEPTANLDPQGTFEVHNLIRKLNKENKVTTIVIEHDISHFVEEADRIIVMDQGKIVLEGPPRDVFAKHSRYLRDELGLWIPGACAFAVECESKGYSFQFFPLVTQEVRVEDLKFKPGATSATSRSVTAQEPIIDIRDVSFSYDPGKEVLHDVSLKVAENSILAIVGQNGSGKTTLTSLLIGLHRPDSGSIEVAGIDATTASIHDLSRKIGYVFQYPEHQFVTDTVYDEVAFSLRGAGFSESEVDRRVMDMLKIFQLDSFIDRHPFALSRGQKRRLSVASMLVLRPDIFILDEPTTGQDWRNVVNLMDILKGLHQEGLTIILVTHSMDLVAEYAERIVVMQSGKVAFDGTPSQLFSTEQSVAESYHLEIPTIYQLTNRIRFHQPNMPVANSLSELASHLEIN